MRIVAGEFKGRSIDSPSEKTTRPTTDRVRESMFSSILSRTSDLSLAGVSVLDAFGGSGALGFEALSRGASRCQFWEQDSDARAILEANGRSLGLDSRRFSCKSGDVLESAKRPLSFGAPYDLVLLDPPYALAALESLGMVASLAKAGALANDAIVVYEHALSTNADADEAELSCGFALSSRKKYGETAIDILRLG